MGERRPDGALSFPLEVAVVVEVVVPACVLRVFCGFPCCRRFCVFCVFCGFPCVAVSACSACSVVQFLPVGLL